VETDGGVRFAGTGPIFDYLRTLDPGEHEPVHRERYAEHEHERREVKTRRSCAANRRGRTRGFARLSRIAA